MFTIAAAAVAMAAGARVADPGFPDLAPDHDGAVLGDFDNCKNLETPERECGSIAGICFFVVVVVRRRPRGEGGGGGGGGGEEEGSSRHCGAGAAQVSATKCRRRAASMCRYSRMWCWRARRPLWIEKLHPCFAGILA